MQVVSFQLLLFVTVTYKSLLWTQFFCIFSIYLRNSPIVIDDLFIAYTQTQSQYNLDFFIKVHSLVNFNRAQCGLHHIVEKNIRLGKLDFSSYAYYVFNFITNAFSNIFYKNKKVFNLLKSKLLFYIKCLRFKKIISILLFVQHTYSIIDAKELLSIPSKC